MKSLLIGGFVMVLVCLSCSTTGLQDDHSGLGDENGTVNGDVVLKQDAGVLHLETLDFARSPESTGHGDAARQIQCDPGEGCFLDKCSDNK